MKQNTSNTKPKKRKKACSVLYSAVQVSLLLLILMQIGLVVGTTYYLEAYKDFIYGIFVLMRVVVLIYIINDSGMPEFRLRGFCLLFAMPG